MNEAVESIYAGMFAPQPIPIEVIELYDSVNFFVKKSGLSGMKMIDLCQIAGTALYLKNSKAAPENRKQDLDGHGIIDTADDSDIPNPVEKVKMYVDGMQDDVFESAPVDGLPAPPTDGRTMDAPRAPDPNNKRKGNIAKLLQKMTQNELLSHAKDICGISPQKLTGKKGFLKKEDLKKIPKETIINAIMESSK